ncbi:MAG: hypothetical protein FD153_1904 [Rhodospirillaceae bacterium]|nr:MAG: hypothetical protein FD153_1904 [Rhodospirillaceae bacterium]
MQPHIFDHLPVGSTLTVAASVAANAGKILVITGNTGLTLTVIHADRVEAGNASTLFAFAPKSYYRGDQLNLDHSTDEDRTIALGINTSDPAFEKALRAIATIAQGGGGLGRQRIPDRIRHEPPERRPGT